MSNIETLTIDEVISGLTALKRNRGLTGEEPVVVASNYGDRARTMQAVTLDEIETGTLTETSYSDSGFAVNEDEPMYDDQLVVVLNYDSVGGF